MTFSNLLRRPGEILLGKKKRGRRGDGAQSKEKGFTDYLAETSE
jgi:hypothetical protein